jgi:hypothetical protein
MSDWIHTEGRWWPNKTGNNGRGSVRAWVKGVYVGNFQQNGSTPDSDMILRFLINEGVPETLGVDAPEPREPLYQWAQRNGITISNSYILVSKRSEL